ncbi:unnamed protein product [Rotaria sordida]|uniref:Uncharacterized protein n=1 Tax=Rotaria sordida TaxID=392033 RepID=A0A814VS94_9BILA|nr:unnamed protein product [Rotaria sordida]CAF3717727.1 unnamed protein product [Rotaria sordida]
MANIVEEKSPLIGIANRDFVSDELVLSNNIPLQTRSSNLLCHVSDDKFDYNARNRLIIVFVLCVIFMIIELVGGIISNSTAVASDAAHMSIDAVSILISLVSIYLTRKRPTQKLSYGYIRAEVLGALLSVLTIWIASGILVYMAILRCIDQTFEIKPTEMIIVSAFGVFFNIVMFAVLHFDICSHGISHHGHTHNHNHLHDDQSSVMNIESQHENSKQIKSSENINVRAAIIHIAGDFLQSIAVLIAAIIIKVKPEYKLADPICTFIFSIVVAITTFTVMRDIIFVLMEAVPSNVNYTKITDDLHRLSGVRNAHSLHIWSLSMQRTALSVHLAIDNEHDHLTVLNEAQEMLRRQHSITRVTIQIEPYDEYIMNSCENCRQLDSK